jgi:hypothetical protein
LVAANGLKVTQRAISRPSADHFAAGLTGEGAALQKNRALGLGTRLSK